MASLVADKSPSMPPLLNKLDGYICWRKMDLYGVVKSFKESSQLLDLVH